MSIFNIGIYYIRNTVSGKVYYGSSANIKKRWVRHKTDLACNRHHNIYLQRSWNKHGGDVFVFERIEECPEDILFEVEQRYIDGNVGGYNIGDAGGGDNLTNHPDKEDIIKRRTATLKKNIANMSPVEREIRRERHRGEKNANWRDGGVSFKDCPICNEKIIQSVYNMCHNCRDRTGKNNPFYGKKHTEETKQRLRESSTGVIKSKETVEKITGENSGRFMGYYHTPWGTYPSSSQAQRAHPYLLSNTIYTWCNNPDKVITRIGKSKYLREAHPDSVGCTYRDIGFWFETKQP